MVRSPGFRVLAPIEPSTHPPRGSDFYMPKVLVFESDPEFANVLQAELTARGATPTVVDDANVGLQAAASDKPDLILLTIELPRMNGFSVCNKLKRDPGLKDVPLIIMSSDSTEETFEQHRRLRTRAEDYLRKPIDMVDLFQRIGSRIDLSEGAAEPMDEEDIVIDDDIDFEDAEPLAIDDEIENEGTQVMERPPGLEEALAAASDEQSVIVASVPGSGGVLIVTVTSALASGQGAVPPTV